LKILYILSGAVNKIFYKSLENIDVAIGKILILGKNNWNFYLNEKL
jgi:hypothetical protein